MENIGIVTCQILELEIAHILSNDLDISEIFIIEDSFSMELSEVLKTKRLKQVCGPPGFKRFMTTNKTGISVYIRVMDFGLHSNIAKLRQEVVTAVNELSPFVNSILLGYGICGNAFDNITELFNGKNVPVLLPAQNGKPVDDCVSLIIGGTEKYFEEQCRCAGTMFMNAGFSRRTDKLLNIDLPPKKAHKKEEILNRLWGKYERSLLLTTPVLGEIELRNNTKDFNDRFGLKTDVCKGTLSIINNAWKKAKKPVI